MQRVLNQDQEEQTKFGLYLRPFVSTDHLPVQTSNFRSRGSFDNRAVHFDIETMLKRAFNKKLELLALGRPEDIEEGVARLTVDNNGWQDIVQSLADRATFIIMVPMLRQGTLWEIRMALVDKAIQIFNNKFVTPAE
jgi:hypothetical protein